MAHESQREHEVEKALSEFQRKEIFRALVDVQDKGSSVLQSRKEVAKHFRVSDKQVRQIEEEGLEHEWPPL